MKSKLALLLGLVELSTLGTAVLLYLGAPRFEEDARRTAEAHRDLRQLLAGSLSAHTDTDALGRPLSQPTLNAEQRQLTAAAAFASRVRRLAAEHPASSEADANQRRVTQVLPRRTLVLP